MIKFNRYKVIKYLAIAQHLEAEEDGYYYVYGGFEVYSEIKDSNSIGCLKKKEKYLKKTKRLTYNDLIKSHQGHGLTFLWFKKKSDMQLFMKQYSDRFLDADEIKSKLKQKKIFGFYKSRINMVLEYNSRI